MDCRVELFDAVDHRPYPPCSVAFARAVLSSVIVYRVLKAVSLLWVF
ncbi:hypothetical protein P4N68_10980 [Corynebacterium felinum]|uniref:Uncharacterized protein n=1 Tax=Corynebacterium felinum TaxID=131318 RepID=A0ABU2B7Q8_9CORY|nr:hypothetical protein [Corynebacterium felinum]MDF5821598.1 hypothetical protein [Corynebacterium felinum]MDR7354648.1 hypothetical protein [Corynebacterium felinum]